MKPLTTLLSALLLFASLAGLAVSVRAADTSRPNLIIIYTDDQGYGDVSALNPKSKFKTPHIDRLVREGLAFTDGHCSDTVCTPSRYGLLTGRYSWRTEELKSGVFGAEKPCLIQEGRMTIGSLLQKHNYNTAMVGKWHLGMDFPGTIGDRDWSQPTKDGPNEKGFDYFYGIPASMNYGVLTYFHNTKATTPPTLWTTKKPGLVKGDKGTYRIMPPYGKQRPTEHPVQKQDLEVAPDFIDDQALRIFAAKSIEWLNKVARDAKNNKPFFLYMPLTSPHKPVSPHKNFMGKSKVGAYGDFMIETDFRVGQILKTLDRLKLAENTIVVFTADNGAENTWQRRIEDYNHYSSGIFRGGKRDIYEGGHRVPFVVRWPAVIKKGRKVHDPVSQTDLLATMADIVGEKIPTDQAEDSFSLLPAFKGDGYAKPLRGPVIHHSASGHFAIRSGQWKLNMFRGSGGSLAPKFVTPKGNQPPMELYDMAKDPGEHHNKYAKHPDVVKRLTGEITQIVMSGRSTPGPAVGNDGPKWWKQLTWIPEPAE
ncbi:MAG: sulfatase family protein [Planctomycetota bacterium]